MRKQVVQDLPEINEIKDDGLRTKVIEAWALALAGSSYNSIRELPAYGVPGVLEALRGDQTDHFRLVTRLAIKCADEFKALFPELPIDRDIVIAGAICHDIGKAWEFDPVNRQRWGKEKHRTGNPSVRHPAYGAYICLTAGLPEAVVHMAAAHSAEGKLLDRSLENTILYYVDDAYWHILAAGGMIKPETIPPGFK